MRPGKCGETLQPECSKLSFTFRAVVRIPQRRKEKKKNKEEEGASGIGAERNINQSGGAVMTVALEQITRVSAASGLWSTFTNRVPAPMRHP
ncbi:hypothetical protein AMECASPLE_015924 [Ameca splendens]|uniref:Uncharacterized protein n=1 Tax=Ameca splendens TaxID=208324 RepID=A0ABV0YPE0_9TELE